MLVTWKALNGWHVATAKCDKGAERKRWRLVEEEMRESAERAFQPYGRPLAAVTSFKYLGWVLTAADENWTEVIGNFWKEQKIWACLARIMGQEGAIPRV